MACLRSDYHARARPWPVGYVYVVLGHSVFGSTEIRVRIYRKALRKDFFTKITFRKNLHADFYGHSDIDSVVTNFDPNSVLLPMAFYMGVEGRLRVVISVFDTMPKDVRDQCAGFRGRPRMFHIAQEVLLRIVPYMPRIIGKYVVDQGLDHGHFTRADHLEVDERKNNLSMRISADDRHQEMPRHMKINIDRCTQVPSIDVETPDTRHFGLSRLKTQGQAKLPKCPDEFLT
ncbi:hypothetical protein F2Q68_00015338 [Brassica cretica]|uniref:Uncharacterized protein n=1 Tax=Brassica cretica TaxID=69181 RepID=A0A8S9HUH7_BRACR|nr:hypothetical protein F2Q68_00015338 [Brassica cretica]